MDDYKVKCARCYCMLLEPKKLINRLCNTGRDESGEARVTKSAVLSDRRIFVAILEEYDSCTIAVLELYSRTNEGRNW